MKKKEDPSLKKTAENPISGSVKVIVPTGKRIDTALELAKAINNVARLAMEDGRSIKVLVQNCIATDCDIGIMVGSSDKEDSTKETDIPTVARDGKD